MKLYGLEWIPGAGALGVVLLLLIVPSFALIGLVVIALAAAIALGRGARRELRLHG
jgi:hypothetical protein